MTTERRAALVGLGVALTLVAAQFVVGAAWSLTHDDPTYRELTIRCFEREKGVRVDATRDDPIALTARGGTLRTTVEGNSLTVLLVDSRQESDRIRAAYASVDAGIAARLDARGRYLELWHRAPSPTQRQAAYDCEY